EDPDDLGIYTVVAVIRRRHGLGKALRFVVDTPGADRIHVPPVRLLLRMLQRISVHFRRGRQNEARLFLFGEAERLVRAQRSNLERGNWQLEIVDRARRARPVQYGVDRALDEDVVRDVVLDE